MSTEALAARRVTESLRSIAKYLDEGARLAGAVSPIGVVQQEVTQLPTTPAPRVARLSWEDSGTPDLEFDPETNSYNLDVTGTSLLGVHTLQLVAASDPTFVFTTDQLTRDPAENDQAFTATLSIDEPLEGRYHARVTTETGQTFLRRNAVSIALVDSEEPAPEPEDALELAALIPNTVQPSLATEVEVLLLHGTTADVSEVFIADASGARQDWHVDLRAAVASRSRKRPVTTRESVFVTVNVPDVPDGDFLLVVHSNPLDSEDSLPFFVRTSVSVASGGTVNHG